MREGFFICEIADKPDFKKPHMGYSKKTHDHPIMLTHEEANIVEDALIGTLSLVPAAMLKEAKK